MKLILTIFLSALSLFSYSQVNKVEISEPIDLPKFGWNKVLMMKNGNTVLFHFEQRKSILVKVFDKDHKEIASQKHICKLIDVNALDRSMLHDIIDINNEAVVFLTQDIENKSTMVRLRFNAATAGLISEEIVVQSESFQKKTEAHLLKDPNTDEYAVFGFKYLELNPGAEMKLVKYNGTHQVLKELPLDIQKGEYDYVNFAGAGVDRRGGVQITIIYSKIIQFPDNIDREIVIYYLAPSSEGFVAKKVKMPQGFYPVISAYTYNPFSSNLNLLMKSTAIRDVKNIDYVKVKQVFYPSILLITKDDMSDFSSALLEHARADGYLKSQTDTSRKFYGDIASMYTNDRGLTTMVTESNDWANGKNGDLAITQYDDNGKELWATIIPKAHFNREEKGPYVFNHEMNMELGDYSTFYGKNSTYILFNDLNKNLENKTLVADSVYTYSRTNGLFYKVDRKRALTNGYLFGAPVGSDESKIACIGSQDFDEQNNIYASVIMHREGKKSSYKVAWCYLEP